MDDPKPPAPLLPRSPPNPLVQNEQLLVDRSRFTGLWLSQQHQSGLWLARQLLVVAELSPELAGYLAPTSQAALLIPEALLL